MNDNQFKKMLHGFIFAEGDDEDESETDNYYDDFDSNSNEDDDVVGIVPSKKNRY